MKEKPSAWERIEDFYYNLINTIDPQNKHIARVIYAIEQRGIPSLPIIIGLIIFVIAITTLVVTANSEHITVTFVTPDGTPISNASVYLCGTEYFTDSSGKITLDRDPCEVEGIKIAYAEGFEGTAFQELPRKITLLPKMRTLRVSVAGTTKTPTIIAESDTGDRVEMHRYEANVCYSPITIEGCIQVKYSLSILAKGDGKRAEYNIIDPYGDVPKDITLFLEPDKETSGTLQIKTNVEKGLAYIYDLSDRTEPIETVSIISGFGETSLPAGNYAVIIVPYEDDGTPIVSEKYSFDVHISAGKTTLLAKDIQIPKKTKSITIAPDTKTYGKIRDGYVPLPVPSSSGKIITLDSSDVKTIKPESRDVNMYTLTIETSRWNTPVSATVIVSDRNGIIVASGTAESGTFSTWVTAGTYKIIARVGTAEKTLDVNVTKDLTVRIDLSTWALATFVLSGEYNRAYSAEIQADTPKFKEIVVTNGLQRFEANIPTNTTIAILLKDRAGNIIYTNKQFISTGQEQIKLAEENSTLTIVINIPQEVNGITFLGVFDENGNPIDVDANEALVIGRTYEMRLIFHMPQEYQKKGAGCIVAFKGTTEIEIQKYTFIPNGVRPIGISTEIIPSDGRYTFDTNITIPYIGNASAFNPMLLEGEGDDAYVIIPYSVCTTKNCSGIITYKFSGRYILGVKAAEIGYSVICLPHLSPADSYWEYRIKHAESERERADLYIGYYAKNNGITIQEQRWLLPITTEEPISEGSLQFNPNFYTYCKTWDKVNESLAEELKKYNIKPVVGQLQYTSHTSVGAPIDIASPDAYIVRVCKTLDQKRMVLGANNEIKDHVRLVHLTVEVLPKSRTQATFHLSVKSTTPAMGGEQIKMGNTVEVPMKPWYATYEDLEYRKNIESIKKNALLYFPATWYQGKPQPAKKPMEIGKWYKIILPLYIYTNRRPPNMSILLKGDFNVTGAIAVYDPKIAQTGLVKRAPVLVNGKIEYKIPIYVKPTGERNTVTIEFVGEECVGDYALTDMNCSELRKNLVFPVDKPKLETNAIVTADKKNIMVTISTYDPMSRKPVPATINILLPGSVRKTVCAKYRTVTKISKDGKPIEYRKCVAWTQTTIPNTITVNTDENGVATASIPKELAGKTVKYTVAAPGYKKVEKTIVIPPLAEQEDTEQKCPENAIPVIVTYSGKIYSAKFCLDKQNFIVIANPTDVPEDTSGQIHVAIEGLWLVPYDSSSQTEDNIRWLLKNWLLLCSATQPQSIVKRCEISDANYDQNKHIVHAIVKYELWDIASINGETVSIRDINDVELLLSVGPPSNRQTMSINLNVIHSSQQTYDSTQCEENKYCERIVLSPGKEINYCVEFGKTHWDFSTKRTFYAEHDFRKIWLIGIHAPKMDKNTALEFAKRLFNVTKKSDLLFCRISNAEYNAETNTLEIDVEFELSPTNTDGTVACNVVPKKELRRACGKQLISNVGLMLWATKTSTQPPKIDLNVKIEDAPQHITAYYLGPQKPACWNSCSYTIDKNGQKKTFGCTKKCNYELRVRADKNSIVYTAIWKGPSATIPWIEEMDDDDAKHEIEKHIKTDGVLISSEYNRLTDTYTARFAIPIQALINKAIKRGVESGSSSTIDVAVGVNKTVRYTYCSTKTKTCTKKDVPTFKILAKKKLNIPNTEIKAAIPGQCKPSPESTIDNVIILCQVRTIGIKPGEEGFSLKITLSGIDNYGPDTCKNIQPTEEEFDEATNTILLKYVLPGKCRYSLTRVYGFEMYKGYTDVNAYILMPRGLYEMASWRSGKKTVYVSKITQHNKLESITYNSATYFPEDKRILARGSIRIHPKITVKEVTFDRITEPPKKVWMKSKYNDTVFVSYSIESIIKNIYPSAYPIFPTYDPEKKALYRGIPTTICFIDINRTTIVQLKSDADPFSGPRYTNTKPKELAQCNYMPREINSDVYINPMDKLRIFDVNMPYIYPCYYHFQSFVISENGCNKYLWIPKTKEFNRLQIINYVELGGRYIPVLVKEISFAQKEAEGTFALRDAPNNAPVARYTNQPEGVSSRFETNGRSIWYRPDYDGDTTYCSNIVCNWDAAINTIYNMAISGTKSAQVLFSPGKTPSNYDPSMSVQLIKDRFDLGDISAGYGIVVNIRDRTFCVEDWPAYYIFSSVPGLKFTSGFAGTPVPVEMNVYVYPADSDTVQEIFGKDMSSNCDYVVWVNGQEKISAPYGLEYYGVMLAKSVPYTMDELPENVKELAEKYPIDAFYWVDEENRVYGGYIRNCIVTGEEILDAYPSVYVWGVGLVPSEEVKEGKYQGLPYWVRGVPDCYIGTDTQWYAIKGVPGAYISEGTVERLKELFNVSAGTGGK